LDIQYLTNEEINFVKWDNCINNAHNGNIYAFSWYLDIVSEHWDALVLNDYSAVMPVLYTQKGLFYYTYSDVFTPQLGVFSTDLLKEEIVNAFVKKLSSIYRVFSINLNKYNNVGESVFRQKEKSTYEFDIIESYETIQRRYSSAINDSIELARKNKVTVIKNISPNLFIDLISHKWTLSTNKAKKKDQEKLRKIIAFVYRHGLGEIYVAFSAGNQLCAACLFLKSNRKSNLIYSAITPEGQRIYAMHYLIDYYIKKHAEQTLTLNFENINIPGKEDFCTGFGAGKYYYVNVFNERLTLPEKIMFKLLKV
jgi:hypothetical protein